MPLVIPLRPSLLAYQTRLSVAGVELVFDVQWRARFGRWAITITDVQGNILLGPRQVCVGWSIDVRKQTAALPEGRFVVVRLGSSDEEPGITELGQTVQLQWWSSAEIEALARPLDDGITRVVIA